MDSFIKEQKNKLAWKLKFHRCSVDIVFNQKSNRISHLSENHSHIFFAITLFNKYIRDLCFANAIDIFPQTAGALDKDIIIFIFIL